MSLDSAVVPSPHGAMPVADTIAEALVPPCPSGTERLLTLANRGAAHAVLQLTPEPPGRAILVSSTDPDRVAGEVDPDRLILLPGETVVLLVRLAAR